MALTLTAAKITDPGQTSQRYSFFIVLDGTSLTQAALAFPSGIPTAPNFTSATGPASISKYPTATAGSAIARARFSPGSEGTSGVSSLVKVAPNATNPTTQIDVWVSAAGTSTETVEVVMELNDSAY